MTSFFAFILFSTICVASLLVVSWANHKETRKRLANSKLRLLKAQYEELQQVIATVDQTVEVRAISRILNEEAITLAESMQELAPEDGYVIASLRTSQALAEELATEAQAGRIYRIRESDSQIALSQRHLENAASVMIKKHALGNINSEELNAFKASLAWARLMLHVTSFVAQGHQAVNRGEVLPAMAFYQKAKASLSHSSLADPRRVEAIKQLKNIIDKQRVSLAEDIMPETEFNPDAQQEIAQVEDEPDKLKPDNPQQLAQNASGKR